MRLHCPVCNIYYPLTSPHLTCPNGNSDAVHPLCKVSDESDALIPVETIVERWNAGESGFSIFREQLGSFSEACQLGIASDWTDNLRSLENSAQKMHANGFAPTPLADTETLSTKIGWEPGRLFAKNETATILGSHKARHAIASLLQVQIRHSSNCTEKPRLAIFSCGNAALGAAAIAKSGGYQLFTFVPSGINREIESLLSNMDAKVVKVRRDGAVGQGDPCNNLYQQAVRELSMSAFSCYAYDLWVSVEGAEVLGLEFLLQIAFEQLSEEKLISGSFEPAKLDNIIVQVGGGGLAHGLVNSLHSGLKLGILKKLPRVFLAQTKSCYPLAISYFSILQMILTESQIGSNTDIALIGSNLPLELLTHHANRVEKIAAKVAANFETTAVQAALKTVASKRNHFFKPWSANEPHSIAEGILDDTTYDGYEITRAMMQTGGIPVILSEEQLSSAWSLGKQTTNLNLSATGTAGLAALQLLSVNKIIAPSQNSAVIFTGVENRDAPPNIATQNVLEVDMSSDPIQAIKKYF